MEMVHDFRDKTVAKVRAEVLKEKENDIKKVMEDMSREIERIYSTAQEEKGVAVEEATAQVLKVKEKETESKMNCKGTRMVTIGQ